MTHATMTNSQQSGSADWTLPVGVALRLDIGPGARELRVTEGRLWLTREGSAAEPAEDLWLCAGDTLALDSGSEWVIEGWGDARFQLLVPPRACPTFAKRLSASARASSSLARLSFWRPAPALG